MSDYVNLPTVVVALVGVRYQGATGLVTIRRNLPGHGFGELALPGGFQEGKKGHSLHYTAGKELLEETGLDAFVATARWITRHAETDEFGHNVLFFEYRDIIVLPDDHVWDFDPVEVQEVVVLTEPADLCYPLHTREMVEWFRRNEGI